MGRAGRILSVLFGVAAPGGPLGRSLAACVSFVLLGWAFDAAWAFAEDGTPSLGRIRGMLAGLGLGFLLAVLLGVALGVLVRLSAPAGPRPQGDALPVRVWRWLWQGDPEAQAQRVAAVLGALIALAGFCAAAFAVTRALVIGMAQPHFAAIAIVAAHLVLGLAGLGLYPPARNAARLGVRAVARVPGLRAPFSRAGILVACLLGLGLLLALGLLVAFWRTFSYLPWRPIVAYGAGLAGALAAGRLAGRLPARIVLLGRGGRACLIAAALLALFTLDARGELSRRAVYETLSGRIGYAAALQALDFDRDGSLGVFGGGDCGPFDPRTGPLMVDVPNNGRDEDCDGSDLDAKRLGVEVRRDFRVPKEFPRKPEVVLLTIDTFAAGRMRALGYRREITPRLDSFARRSALFRYCFSQGPSTRLSFPSIFTSRWDSQIEQQLIGSHPYPIADSEQMLAEVMHAEGYDTAAVIPDGYFRKSRWGSLTAGFKQVIDSPSRSGERHNSAAVTDAAIALLQQARKRPLFLWVHYYDAHSPHKQPKDGPRFGSSLADVYDAELRLVDREAGRLLDAVERQLGERALIFVTGDHGIGFDAPRHARFNYGYDLSSVVLHVPLIVHGPLIRAGVSDGIVSTMDIAPTIANLLRMRRKLRFEGASLLPELLDGQRSRPERLLHEFYLEERLWEQRDPLEQISLRTDRYNLIHNRQQGTYELYDWRKDYNEAHDLADAAAHRAAFRALKQQLALLTYRVYDRERDRTSSLSVEAGRP